jgi:hypothetical protein
MKTLVLSFLAMVVFASFATAQVTPGIPTTTGTANAVVPTVDILGAHNNYGRGCAGCHAPHSGARGNGGNAAAGGAVTDTQTGENALFGQDYGPLLGKTLNFGGDVSPTSPGNTFQVITPAIGTLATMTSQQYQDLRGIIMCLACHDGNVAKGAMMQNWAYEQQIGALPSSYGTGQIPTLFGNTAAGAFSYNADHPVGEEALLNLALGAAYYDTPAGLTYNITNGTIASITVGSLYTQFITSYGAPSLLPTAFGYYKTPVSAMNVPYLLCTTCHDQHVMNVFSATAASPIAGSSAGTYATYFFIRGPYNVNDIGNHPTLASTTAQFCRQCHFSLSNEANGGSLPTQF